MVSCKFTVVYPSTKWWKTSRLPIVTRCHQRCSQRVSPLISSQRGSLSQPQDVLSLCEASVCSWKEIDPPGGNLSEQENPPAATGDCLFPPVLYDALCARCCSGLVGYVFLVDGLATLVGSAMVAWVLHFSFLAVGHVLGGIQTFIHYVTHLAERQYFTNPEKCHCWAPSPTNSHWFPHRRRVLAHSSRQQTQILHI
jgi:hypothetical protein